jgi:glycosyltransferase involved in cell wall biosynthesis
MKILIVCPFLPPKIGGVERHSIELAQNLHELGHEVEVVTSKCVGLEYSVHPFRLITLQSFLLQDRLPIPTWSRDNVSKLKNLGQDKYDLLLLQSHLFPICAITLLKMKSNVDKVTWINHGSNFVPSKNLIVAKVLRKYEELQLKLLAKHSHRVVSVSQEAADWISSVSLRSSEVIPNGIPAAAKSPNLFSRNQSPIRFLYAGRFLPDKGALRSLQIFHEVSKHFSYDKSLRMELDLIGDGPEMPSVKKEVSALDLPIRIHGSLTHGELLGIMEQCHILIYPTTYPEGLPTVILEAGAKGMLIVPSLNVPGLNEAASNGVIFPSSISDMSKALTDLVSVREDWDDLSRRTRDYFQSNHDWKSIATQFLGE